MEIKNIFIHGWSFSSKIWKDYKDIENAVFLDLPFHGENKNFPEEEIIKNFVDKVGEIAENSTLIGWSLGASVSVLTALKYPEKIKKLILIGFSPKFKDKELGHNPVAVKAFMLALKVDFKDTIYNFRKIAAGDKFSDIPLPEKDGSIKLLKEFIELDLRDKLKEIKIPVFLIHGKQDKIINPNGSIYASKEFPESKLFLIDGNHAPFLENKKLITDLI